MNGAANSNIHPTPYPPPPVRGPHNFHLNSPLGGQELPSNNKQQKIDI